MSTSHHLQTDIAQQIKNRIIENCLGFQQNYHQDNWDELLPTAEFACNSAVSEDFGVSPSEIDFGWNTKSPLYMLNTISKKNKSVEEFKLKLKETLNDVGYAQKIV